MDDRDGVIWLDGECFVVSHYCFFLLPLFLESKAHAVIGSTRFVQVNKTECGRADHGFVLKAS